jgi:hypothetical protein
MLFAEKTKPGLQPGLKEKGTTMTAKNYQSPQNESTRKLKLVKSKADVRLGGTLPTRDMQPGKYLVLCESAWLEPMSKATQEHRAVFQFKVIDSKYDGTALRMWIDKAADAGGIISPTGKYARGIAKSLLVAPSKRMTRLTSPAKFLPAIVFWSRLGIGSQNSPKGRAAKLMT